MRLLIVVLFVLMLLAPGLQMLSRALPIPPLDENRAQKALPPLSALADPADYTARLQAWFDDHYGLRDLLIRAKTQLDYSLFHTSDRIHIGRRGWLFYRNEIDTQEPQMETLLDRDLDQCLATFAALRDLLAGRGIKLLIQTTQEKDRFYPEFLPQEAAFARSRHRFDDFRQKLAALPGVTYLDTTPKLLALKSRRPIFHKTDFHWNDPAAFEAARRLIDTIAGLEGRATPFWKPELRIVERRFSGGQALFMPLFRPPSEDGLFLEPGWDDQQLRHEGRGGPFEWRDTAHDPSASLLPTTVIFGDSFVDGMARAGLAIHFNRIQFARLYGAELPDILDQLPADTRYFVVEFIEVSMPSWIAMKLTH